MIIDCHGHYTTAPKALEDWRNRQVAAIKNPSAMPKVADLRIGDDELRTSIETNQLRFMKERSHDLTIFSPRASFMAHHIGDFQVSSTWAAICNELIFRVSTLFPDHFIGCAMLPQSPGVDPQTCVAEIDKCAKQYGFVAINLNFLTPEAFLPAFTFIGYAVLVLGGLASYWGVAAGAIIMWTILEGTRFIDLPISAEREAAVRFMIVGLVLILLMAFRPQGIFGKKEEMVLGD